MAQPASHRDRIRKTLSPGDPSFGLTALARGADVLAAGEVRFFQGSVKQINNASGHYKSAGDSARSAAESAFINSGFAAAGRYVEGTFK